MALTEVLYVESATSQLERLNRIDAIILALENRILTNAAGTSDKSGYSLNDGQVTISTQYRSVDEMANAIRAFDKMRERILNKLNGSNMILRPWRGLV
jgi:hypothetical protein